MKSPTRETSDSGIQINQVKELVAPVIVVTQEINDSSTADSHRIQSDPVMDLLQYESSDSESVKIWEEISDSDPLEVLESLTSFEDAPEDVPQSSSPEVTTNTIAEVQDLEKLPEDSSVCQSMTFSTLPTSQEEYPKKISLETLSEAIVCDDKENVTYQSTDKAIYIKGPIVENWQVASQKEGIETDQSRSEGGTGEQKVNDGEIEHEQSVEMVDEKVENAKVIDNTTGSEKEEPASSQPTEMQKDNNTEQSLDSVAAIRDLVTEVTEVEITINPCPANAE